VSWKLTINAVARETQRVEIELSVIENGISPVAELQYREHSIGIESTRYRRQPDYDLVLSIFIRFYACHAISRYFMLV